MARPGYPAYRNTLQAMGCRVLSWTADHSRATSPPSRCSEARCPSRRPGWWWRRRRTRPGRSSTPTSWLPSRGGVRRTTACWSATRSTTASRTGGSVRAWQTSRESVVVGSFSKYFDDRVVAGLDAPAVVAGPAGRAAARQPGDLRARRAQAAAVAAFTPQARAELDSHAAVCREPRDPAGPAAGAGRRPSRRRTGRSMRTATSGTSPRTEGVVPRSSRRPGGADAGVDFDTARGRSSCGSFAGRRPMSALWSTAWRHTSAPPLWITREHTFRTVLKVCLCREGEVWRGG